jgi:hypothetical protein
MGSGKTTLLHTLTGTLSWHGVYMLLESWAVMVVDAPPFAGTQWWKKYGRDCVIIEADQFKSVDPVYALLTEARLPNAAEKVHAYSTKVREPSSKGASRRYAGGVARGPHLHFCRDAPGGGGALLVGRQLSAGHRLRQHPRVGAISAPDARDGARLAAQVWMWLRAAMPTEVSDDTWTKSPPVQSRYLRGPGYVQHADGSVTERYWVKDGVIPREKAPVPYRVQLVGVFIAPELAVERAIVRRCV